MWQDLKKEPFLVPDCPFIASSGLGPFLPCASPHPHNTIITAQTASQASTVWQVCSSFCPCGLAAELLVLALLLSGSCCLGEGKPQCGVPFAQESEESTALLSNHTPADGPES